MNIPSQQNFKRSVFRAFLLSLLLPGAGQFYNGQMWKGVLILALSLTIVFIPLLWLVGIIDAPISAIRINQGKARYKRRPVRFRVLIYLLMFLLIIGVILPNIRIESGHRVKVAEDRLPPMDSLGKVKR